MEAIIYYLTWPVLIYILWKFIDINIRHMQDLERLDTYDKQASPRGNAQQPAGSESKQ